MHICPQGAACGEGWRCPTSPRETQPGNAPMSATTGSIEQSTMRKVLWRIVPYCFGLYVISYLDRANIGYAALQMNKELALTSEAFGFAAGIFFIGYFLLEVPSNVALNKYGARVWI